MGGDVGGVVDDDVEGLRPRDQRGTTVTGFSYARVCPNGWCTRSGWAGQGRSGGSVDEGGEERAVREAGGSRAVALFSFVTSMQSPRRRKRAALLEMARASGSYAGCHHHAAVKASAARWHRDAGIWPAGTLSGVRQGAARGGVDCKAGAASGAVSGVSSGAESEALSPAGFVGLFGHAWISTGQAALGVG